MTSSCSKSSSRGHVESENDDTRRRARVYILKTTVGIGGPMTIVNHWALVFKFDSGSYPWVIIEGTQNEDGRLVGNYRSQSYKPDGTLIDPHGFFTILWSTLTLNVKQFLSSLVLPKYVNMSPSEIRQVALNNHLNGKVYILYLHDCQMWVGTSAKHLRAA